MLEAWEAKQSTWLKMAAPPHHSKTHKNNNKHKERERERELKCH